MRVGLFLLGIVLAHAAFARAWFDGGINRHWSAFTSGGEWTNDGGGRFVSDYVLLNAELDAPATFAAEEPKTLSQSVPSCRCVMDVVLGSWDVLPDPSEVGKAAIVVLGDGENPDAYCVLEKDGATNRWARVAGTPDVTKRCRVELEFTLADGSLRVTYKVDDVTLAVRDVAGEPSLGEVCYAGESELVSLAGSFETDMVRFDVQAMPGCLVGAVSHGGTVLAYPYEVPAGSLVTVEYHAYGNTRFPNGTTTVLKDFTVDVDGQVVAVPAEAIPVQAVARVKDDLFMSLASAFAAAQDGDTVTLLDDVADQSTLVLTGMGEIVLDLNGHALVGMDNEPLLRVGGGTTLTLVNDSPAESAAMRHGGGSALVAVDGGRVVMRGRREDCALGSGADLAFYSTAGGTVVVDGGAVDGRIEGDGVEVCVYTNGPRFASARFTQDETARLSPAAKAKGCRMVRASDGSWSVGRLIMWGSFMFIR